jgi:hypothetical protein
MLDFDILMLWYTCIVDDSHFSIKHTLIVWRSAGKNLENSETRVQRDSLGV